MSIYEKLLDIQRSVDSFLKDGENKSDKYKYVSSDAVLNVVRPKMNELGLLLIPQTVAARVHEGTSKSGTTRYLTELDKNFVWVDTESKEMLSVPFYAQGVDLAGEKGVGKAETYAEKYFLLKLFHVPTGKDDPDGDKRTKTGELKQSGTQAEKETVLLQRQYIAQMAHELTGGDAEKIKRLIKSKTKSEKRHYEGADSIDDVRDEAIKVLYGNMKTTYEKQLGRPFAVRQTGGEDGDT